ncbi:HEAT repeat domain-containing protein [Streptomyces sp. NPDC054956]
MTNGDPEVIAAARAGDAERVLALLDAGADPDTVDADGLSLLDVVAAEGLAATAARLVRQVTELGRRAPDGWTPLLRAVDAGSYEVVDELFILGAPLEDTTPEGLTAIELARHWHETGAENELRRRTGATGPAELVRVAENSYSSTGLLRLGGARVRTGHAAILTLLEWRQKIRTPFEELLARAEAEPDLDHVVHGAVSLALGSRGDRETWEAAVALRGHPRAAVRHFAAGVLRSTAFFDNCGDGLVAHCVYGPGCFALEATELFLEWAAGERHPEVLEAVLDGLFEAAPPEADRAAFEVLLPHHGHPFAGVRRQVAKGMHLTDPSGAEAAGIRSVLLAYLRDPDAAVRGHACNSLRALGDRSAGVRDALAALLADPDPWVPVCAARTLVLLDDPRGEAAIPRLTEGQDEETRRYGDFADAFVHLERRARERDAGPDADDHGDGNPGPGPDRDPVRADGS